MQIAETKQHPAGEGLWKYSGAAPALRGMDLPESQGVVESECGLETISKGLFFYFIFLLSFEPEKAIFFHLLFHLLSDNLFCFVFIFNWIDSLCPGIEKLVIS